MKKMAIHITHLFKKHKLTSVCLMMFAICACWWGIANIIPHPLGDKLQYLGKEDMGVFISDSPRYTTYYYGTNLDPDAMKNIFNAKYSPLENLAIKHARFTSDTDEFMFTYEQTHTFHTTKKYVVAIGGSEYKLARKYLKK